MYYTRVSIFRQLSLQVCCNLFCRNSTTFENRLFVSLLKIDCWEAYIRVRFSTTRFVHITNLASVKFHGHPCPFWNHKARAKIKRRPVEQCTRTYTVQRQVFLTKNLLLCGTTDVLVGNDTLSVFSSGTDAARIKQKQVCLANLCSAKYMDVLRWTGNAVDDVLSVSLLKRCG